MGQIAEMIDSVLSHADNPAGIAAVRESERTHGRTPHIRLGLILPMDIATVIVAAGSGSRFGGSLPKQFLMLEGKPVLCHSIDTFRGTFPEAPIVLVLSDEGRLWWDEFCRPQDTNRLW